MKRPTGSHRLFLASSVTDKALVDNSERRLHEVVEKLEACRTVLDAGGDWEASQLVSVAILQIRMKLNRIADSDLKALCDAIEPHEEAERAQDPKSRQGRSRLSPAVLKLVK